MPSRAEVLGDRTIRGQKAVGVPGGFEPLHPPLSLARGLVGVLGPMIQIAVVAAFDTGGHLPFRGAVALELVRDDHPWDILTPLEELPKELLGGLLVASALDQDSEDSAVLIHWGKAFCPLHPYQLAYLQLVHELDADQCTWASGGG